jgi:hypothetical protein
MPLPARVHGFLVGLIARAVHLLPASARGRLDAWSRRVAHERALRRQRGSRDKR